MCAWVSSLVIFFSFVGHTTWHVGYYFPDQGLNLHPLQQKHGILTTGPPGKYLILGVACFSENIQNLSVFNLAYFTKHDPFQVHACMRAKLLQLCLTLCNLNEL